MCWGILIMKCWMLLCNIVYYILFAKKKKIVCSLPVCLFFLLSVCVCVCVCDYFTCSPLTLHILQKNCIKMNWSKSSMNTMVCLLCAWLSAEASRSKIVLFVYDIPYISLFLSESLFHVETELHFESSTKLLDLIYLCK